MNSDISKSHTLPSTLVLESKLYKKSKRKRRRNKFFLSKFKKTNKKKFQTQNTMSHQNISSKSKKSRYREEMESSGSDKFMSNWYWSNYKKAVEWQDKHKIAHWKACALALQEENRYLMQIIHSMQSGMYLNVPTTMKNLEKKVNASKKMTKSKCSERRVKKENVEEVVINNEDLNDEEIEFEMSEEMIKFFEQSYKHKMDLEKAKKEKEELNAENEVKQIQENKLKRCEEMKLLYGDAASMIIGMETAVQLSFDRYCDTKSPKYWPNIPLRL